MRKIKILLKSVYLMTDLLLILQLLLNRLRQFFVQWHIWHRKILFVPWNYWIHFRRKKYDKIQRREDKVDRYEDKLGTYLVKITQQELTSGQNKEVSKLLHTISDFERISDHAVNISQAARELFNEKLRFSDCAVEDVELMSLIMKEIVGNVIDAFEQNKVEYAYKTEPLEELVDIYCDEMKMNHASSVSRKVNVYFIRALYLMICLQISRELLTIVLTWQLRLLSLS